MTGWLRDCLPFCPYQRSGKNSVPSHTTYFFSNVWGTDRQKGVGTLPCLKVKDTFRAPKDRHSYTFDQHIYTISSPSLQLVAIDPANLKHPKMEEMEGYSPVLEGVIFRFHLNFQECNQFSASNTITFAVWVKFNRQGLTENPHFFEGFGPK